MKYLKTHQILGLDKRAWDLAPISIKKSYNNIVLAMFFVSAISVATGIEVTSQFIDSLPILIFGGIIYGIIILCVDYFLVSGESTRFNFIVRSIFGGASVIIGVISVLLIINTNDIHNLTKSQTNTSLDSLSTAYQKAKIHRYKLASEKDSIIADYHNEKCLKEAKNKYAGSSYNRIHNSYCVEEEKKLSAMTKILDSAEVSFATAYNETTARFKEESRLGLFEKVTILFQEILFPNVYKIGFAILLFIFLLGIEFTALFAKMNIKKENGFAKLKSVIESEDHTFALDRIAKENEITKAKLESNSDLLKTEANLDSKITKLLLVQNMKNQFLKARAVNPELWSDELLKKGNTIFEDAAFKLNDELKKEFNITEGGAKKPEEATEKKTYKTITEYNLFYLTTEMKILACSLIRQAQGSQNNLIKLLYNWSLENLEFESEHNLTHYKYARHIFQERKGICGELTIFFIAMLRYASIEAEYVHVEIDQKGQKVNHACVGVNINSNYFLVDIAYKSINANHRQWQPLGFSTLLKNVSEWNS